MLMLIALHNFFDRSMLLDVPADSTQNIFFDLFFWVFFLVLLMFRADRTVLLLDIQFL